MSGHTPGPWVLNVPDCEVRIPKGHNGFFVAYAGTEANARLIAAAPEMYEALHEARLQLEYLSDKFQPTGSGVSTLAKVNAAIAKAEGRQP